MFLVLQGDLHGFIPVVQRVLPGVKQEQQADLTCRVACQRVLDAHKVFQRLGHLAALDGQMTGVQEVTHPVVVLVVGLEKTQSVINNNAAELVFSPLMIMITIMKNFNRRNSHGHHGSKRRELAQHAHSHGLHAFTYINSYIITTMLCKAPAQLLFFSVSWVFS